ncbi:MAG: hypothetical protein LC109_10990 [Bacteroidia bacterium]|nr:hypothetical protein [Bacteroidia bacterium]
MITITSTNFYGAWLDTVKYRKDKMLSIWRNNKEFTSYIKGSDNSVLSEIAQAMNLKCYEKDYYSVDAIFYKETDLTPKINENNYWFRHITIAFEHENNFKGGLYQEVSHLLITNSDLKVLVTYPNEDITNQFDYLHEIVKGCKHSNTISDEENFLIILGYENGFEWEGYIFKQDKWLQLDDSKCLEMFQIEKEIAKTKIAKNEAVLRQEFEMSSALRDKEKMLGNKLEELQRQ